MDCIDPSLINTDAICFFIYDPVCGCDNVTYSNSCYAENSGVLSWVNGEVVLLQSYLAVPMKTLLILILKLILIMETVIIV